MGEGFYAGGGELEADEPLAGNAAAVCFGGVEFPAAHGFQREVREVLAGAGILEIGGGDVAGSVDVGQHGDAYFAGNGGQSFFGGVRQNLVQHFAFS